MAAVAIQNGVTNAHSVLATVSRGRIEKAPRVLLYAREKIGKTGFAAGSPNPIFLCSEMGTEEYDVARIGVTDWVQVFNVVDALIADAHDYKTLVIDTLDHLEAVLHRWIIASDGKASSMISASGGYGKAYKVATENFRKLAAKLDVLTERRGMTIVLLAHAHIEKFNDPESDGWDQYRLKMHKEAAGFFKEWVDAVLFANLDIAAKEDKGEKTKAINTGDRYIFTVPPKNAAYEAGNRWALPPKMKLRWSSFSDALAASHALRSELVTLVAKLPADKRAAAEQKAREAKDYDALKEIVARAREMTAPAAAATNSNNSSKEISK